MRTASSSERSSTPAERFVRDGCENSSELPFAPAAAPTTGCWSRLSTEARHEVPAERSSAKRMSVKLAPPV